MAQDGNLPNPLDTGTSAAETTNATLRNQQLSSVIQEVSDSSDAQLALLTQIAAAITADIIGGSTGSNANRILLSKGTGGRALQAGVTSLDPSTGVIAGTAVWNGSPIGPVYGGTGIANNAANTLTWSGNFAATFTLSNTTAVTFPTSGTLATLNTNTWAQQQGFARQNLTDASTIAWNAQTQQTAYVLLTSGVGATRAMGTPSNLVAGFTYILFVQQSSTGTNALTYSSNYKWPGGTTPTLSTANNAIDILTFVSDGTNVYGSIQKAFA